MKNHRPGRWPGDHAAAAHGSFAAAKVGYHFLKAAGSSPLMTLGGAVVALQLPPGGRTARVVRSLALTADAIARGLPVPREAQRIEPPIPAWLYRFLADLTFLKEADVLQSSLLTGGSPGRPP